LGKVVSLGIFKKFKSHSICENEQFNLSWSKFYVFIF
jgi:hypothetical protein